ncbi:pectinesterase 2-like [Actinidia eriantha]|uniref:pectinesterase 2-like n=1 Tax=Actinidia eriantha TaxID=165200 RepID=UPI00258F36FB|nr:pectinesterase 2-like [Actinidia eriantha]
MQSTITYNATVAQDRSGNHTSINDAIAAAPENIVGGPGFIAESLTIENSAPQPNSHQAVALNNIAYRSAFYKCAFLGYRDTLYANHHRQFYKKCDIYGSIDFVFDSVKAKADPTEPDNGSFQNCKITAVPHKSEVKAYLGRPWRNYATVVFMESYLDDIVTPKGWMPLGNNTKMLYAEYNKRGPGANTSKRVKWPGYKVFTSATEAIPFTVSKWIDGDTWIPETGIPYKGGL